MGSPKLLTSAKNHPNSSRDVAKKSVALLAGLTLWTTAVADRSVYQSEPNDTPENFLPITGAVTLYGTMVGTDQDGFLWTVSDDDARKRWTFTLSGEPGALTIAEFVRLQYDDSGADITGTRTLMKMGTRDGVTPSVHEDLLFEPGEYVIGLAQAGAGRGQESGALYWPRPGQSFDGRSTRV